jgi:Asp-tRNA(Asn)/Glu-tRNA(Gln) amidotransferase A subunit family amidase
MASFAGAPFKGRTPGWFAVVLCLIASPLTGEPPTMQTQAARKSTLVLEEATISGVHAALAGGDISCAQVVQAHLRRIEAYDDRGPALNALISINPAALDTAAELDRIRGASSSLRPLHCIPVILKDNFDTADMPTTGGSLTLAASVPLRDAFVVRKLREAGAIILAKANLTELARGGTTVSSLGGQTKNPYDLTRTPGGSSGGTAAAIAASFAVTGTGSDTGQSVRSPASAQSLVGLRPTRGLVSRAGIIPVSTTQDEAGPITRTVEDAARMLDVMAGYDPADPITAFGAGRIPRTYTAFLNRESLKGARIGVLTEYFGREAIHEEVNTVTERALAKMADAGATIVRIMIPALDRLTRNIQVAGYEAQRAFNDYLAALGPGAPVKTLDEFVARGQFHSSLKAGLDAERRVGDGFEDPEYKNRLLRRNDLRQAVMQVIAANALDAILYPHQRRLVVPIGEEQVERNGVLSNSTGFPAITFPGGFSRPTASAPLGVPVGIELLGPEWSEPRLIALAFAFEQVARPRRPPASTPPLDR